MGLFTLKGQRSPRQRTEAPRREQCAQWGVIAVVSLVLGGYTVILPRLPLTWGALSLFAIIAPFVVLVVGDLRRLLLAILVFDIPMQVDGHFFYRTAMATWGTIAGVNYSLTTIALAGLYTVWFIKWLVQPRWGQPALGRRQADNHWITPLVPLSIYVACVALSLVVAVDRQLATFELVLLLQILLLVIYIVATVRTTDDLLFLVRLILLALLLQSLIMIGLRLLGHSLTLGPLQARIDPDQRVGGTIGGPNTAAGYLTLVLPVALALFWAKIDRFTHGLAVVSFGLGMMALGFTLSRGGTIGTLIALALVFVLCWRRQGWSMVRLCILGGVGALLLYFGVGPLFATRLAGGDQGAATGRLPLIILALQIIRDHPLFGVGANNFAVVMVDYLTPDFSRDWLYIVHNKYLLVWAELGPLGLGAYLWFLLSTVRLGWHTWQQREATIAPLVLGVTAGIVGHLIHMQVDIFNSRQLVQMLWLQAALIIASSPLLMLQPANPSMRKVTHHGRAGTNLS